MSPDPASADGIAAALTETLKTAREVARAQEQQAGEDGEPPTGDAAGGLVRATAALPGKVKVDIDPRAARLGTEALAEAVTEAVNSALAALRGQAQDASGVDLAALSERLEEIQKQSAAQLGGFLTRLTDAHQRLASRGDGGTT
ncbi:YbaB/EbfC family nucleoid-associated protein [Phytomonospora sp. NPDC050363]|uniref:YbaB/EbfC family nucleoid-associated protein n=1 Tax=Phytomonospora sp. NPDC050363 TaxID=3155642 RepID=UPI0033C83EB0